MRSQILTVHKYAPVINVFDGTLELTKADGTKIQCSTKGPLKPYLDENPDFVKYQQDSLKGKASVQQLRNLAPFFDQYIEVVCARSILNS